MSLATWSPERRREGGQSGHVNHIYGLIGSCEGDVQEQSPISMGWLARVHPEEFPDHEKEGSRQGGMEGQTMAAFLEAMFLDPVRWQEMNGDAFEGAS